MISVNFGKLFVAVISISFICFSKNADVAQSIIIGLALVALALCAQDSK